MRRALLIPLLLMALIAALSGCRGALDRGEPATAPSDLPMTGEEQAQPGSTGSPEAGDAAASASATASPSPDPTAKDSSDGEEGLKGMQLEEGTMPMMKLLPAERLQGCHLWKTMGRGTPEHLGLLTSRSPADCSSYDLALRYADRRDVLRLIQLTTPALADRMIQEINSAPAGARYFTTLLTADGKGGQWEDPGKATRGCRTLRFFGVDLYCFGAVTKGSGHGAKENHLQDVIAPLTFLMMSSYGGVRNPIIDRVAKPFDLLAVRGVAIADAIEVWEDEEETAPIAEIFSGDFKCTETQTANLQFRLKEHLRNESIDQETKELLESTMDEDNIYRFPVSTVIQPVIFQCRKLKTDEGLKMHVSAIFYHEGNHLFGGPHDTDCFDKGERRDRTLRSVYGAHVFYLMGAAQTPWLGCGERKFLYERGVQEVQAKLCFINPFDLPPPPDCE